MCDNRCCRVLSLRTSYCLPEDMHAAGHVCWAPHKVSFFLPSQALGSPVICVTILVQCACDTTIVFFLFYLREVVFWAGRRFRFWLQFPDTLFSSLSLNQVRLSISVFTHEEITGRCSGARLKSRQTCSTCTKTQGGIAHR